MARGRGRSAGVLRIQFLSNGLPFARIALVVPKRFARRSVDRSRLRRIIREAFRLRQSTWSGYDCVVRLRSVFQRDPALDKDREFANFSAALFEPGPPSAPGPTPQ